MEEYHVSVSEATSLIPNPACPDSFAGESIMTYMTAVLTDLLHTQRDPLALCLLLQSYDKVEPVSPLCGQLLAQFHRYYSLWIPEQAQEALVSCTHCSLRVSSLVELQGPDAVQFTEPVLNLPLSSAYKRNASHVITARLMAMERLPSDKTALSLLQLGLFLCFLPE